MTVKYVLGKDHLGSTVSKAMGLPRKLKKAMKQCDLEDDLLGVIGPKTRHGKKAVRKLVVFIEDVIREVVRSQQEGDKDV